MEYENHVLHIGMFFTRINEPEKYSEKRGEEKQEKRYFGNYESHKFGWVFPYLIYRTIFGIHPSVKRSISVVQTVHRNGGILYFIFIVKIVVERKPFCITFCKRHTIQFRSEEHTSEL